VCMQGAATSSKQQGNPMHTHPGCQHRHRRHHMVLRGAALGSSNAWPRPMSRQERNKKQRLHLPRHSRMKCLIFDPRFFRLVGECTHAPHGHGSTLSTSSSSPAGTHAHALDSTTEPTVLDSHHLHRGALCGRVCVCMCVCVCACKRRGTQCAWAPTAAWTSHFL